MEIVLHSIFLIMAIAALVLVVHSMIRMYKYNKHQKLVNSTFFETEATCKDFRVFEMSSIKIDDVNDPKSSISTKIWYEIIMYGYVDGTEIKLVWGVTDETGNNQTARKFSTIEEAVKEYTLAYQLKNEKNRNIAVCVKDSVRYRLSVTA